MGHADYKHPGESLIDFFKRHEFNYKDDPSSPVRRTFLDGALVNLTEFYAAIEVVNKESHERQVFAMIILLNMFKLDQNGFNISYRAMDEDCGAYACNCPERIMRLLTPENTENANVWRTRCWENIAKRQSLKISAGNKLVLSEPVQFKSGVKESSFIVDSSKGGRIRCHSENGYHNFILTRQWLLDQKTKGNLTVIEHAYADQAAPTRKLNSPY